jgi:hypothetical protein
MPAVVPAEPVIVAVPRHAGPEDVVLVVSAVAVVAMVAEVLVLVGVAAAQAAAGGAVLARRVVVAVARGRTREANLLYIPKESAICRSRRDY